MAISSATAARRKSFSVGNATSDTLLGWMMNNRSQFHTGGGGQRFGPPQQTPGAVSKLQAAFGQALSFHRSGQLEEAEKGYRNILKAQPDHFDSLHLLGVIYHQRGNHAQAVRQIDVALKVNPNVAFAYNNRGNALRALRRPHEALASFERAIALKPDYAEAFFNRGDELQELKRLDEAVASYDKALALEPGFAPAFYSRGCALHKLKRFDEAVASFDKATALKPDHADAYNDRGNALHELNRLDEALASYDKALALRPNSAETFNNRGNALHGLKRFDEALASYDRALALSHDYAEALNNRGAALRQLKRYDEALASYDRALALKPDHADALYNRGNVLHKLDRLDEALASFDKALALKPDYAEAFINRGNVLGQLKRLDEALASFDKALALKPDSSETFNSRGTALHGLKRFDEAMASFDRALALKPNNADAFKNRALCRLLVGQYAEGWSDYEWRWDAMEVKAKRPEFPDWHGEKLEGRRLLVFAEQGLGDIIQFARYLPLLAKTRCRLTFLVDAKLARLLRPLTSGIEVVSTPVTERNFDFQCALMSLPHHLGTDLTSIPNSVPYLRAEDDLVIRWRQRIGGHGFKIGIAWQGNPQNPMGQGRSISLMEYLGLARLPGIRLISLQKHHGLDQLAGLPKDLAIETLGEDFDAGPDAFVDAAAVMSSLDLVITSDTSIAHLAGALGRPAWVALGYVPDWRWMLDRNDSPWYPTLRLFRQPERDNWKPVFSKMESELRSMRNECN